VYFLLHLLNFSWITSRSRAPKQSEEIQEDFKKFQNELIELVPNDLSLDHIDIWFQDEARFGQQNTTTRIWAEKGTRPRVVKQQQFTSAYLFGAVCLKTGTTEAFAGKQSSSSGNQEYGTNLKVIGRDLDDIIQAVESTENNIIGLQWHPEYLFYLPSHFAIFRWLVNCSR